MTRTLPLDSYDTLNHGDTLVVPAWHHRPDCARHFQFRHSVVPDTGRRHRGGFYRYPQTHGAHRAAEFLSELIRAGEIPSERGIAKLARLPDAWDDVPRSDSNDRSWKRHRRQQYHAL